MLTFHWLYLLIFLAIPTLSFSVPCEAKVYFAPEDALEERLVELIVQEKKFIYVCIYSLTHRRIVDSLIDAHQRGVIVEVLVDPFSVRNDSLLHRLITDSIPVYVWDPVSNRRKRSHRSLMHHKFCVFGQGKVWTGSFNFTYEASRKHLEDVVVIESASLSDVYSTQFHLIKRQAGSDFASYLTTHPKAKKKMKKIAS